MDDPITPREHFEDDALHQQPNYYLTVRQSQNSLHDNERSVYYEISEADLQRLASQTGVILFQNEEDIEGSVFELLQDVVEQVSATVDIEDLVVDNEFEYNQHQDNMGNNEGGQDSSLIMPYERKRKPKAPEDSYSYRRFICYWCDQKFRCYSHLKQHVQKHLTNNPIKCDVCGKTFTQKGSLTTHMFLHTGERPHKCVKCGRAFITKTMLRKHLRTHTNERPYCCDICDASFRMLISLKKHKLKHAATAAGTLPLFKCSNCPAQFSEKDDLKRHKAEVHSVVGETDSKKSKSIDTAKTSVFQCDVCHKTFKRQTYLRKHMQRHIRGKYECTICHKEFAEKESLKAHNGLHTGEQPFQCEICNIKFSVASYLKRHMAVHVDEASFECDICHSKYRSVALLSRHKKIHLEVKPHKCTVCGNGFVSSSDLKRHMRTHTGEKPFACQHCGQRFTQTSSLRKHLEKKHPALTQQIQHENLEAVQSFMQWIDSQSQEQA